jgi:hypothetical protein
MDDKVKKVEEQLNELNGGKPFGTKKLADFLGYGTDAIRVAVMRGKLPNNKLLGRHRFYPGETARYLVTGG